MNTTPLLELQAVSKLYPNGTLANDSVSLSIRRGQVHAILGENGAGKSTVMKMLYGLEQPSAGRIVFKGAPVAFNHPRDAIAAGIGLVPQHFKLVPSFTVAQNVVLGCEPTRFGMIDRAAMAASVGDVARRFGLDVDPGAVVAGLSAGEQQRVEILKALYRGAEVLLLDEPTAVLTAQETAQLFTALRQLVGRGLTVILITHKLAEVREVSDRFTVMRAGRVTGHAESGGASEAAITEMIVGRALSPHPFARPGRASEVPLVRVTGLGAARPDGRPELHGVSFEIGAGEILGIAGVEGNGQQALAEILSGLREPGAGAASVNGAAFVGRGVRHARACRVASIPEDRLRDGAAVAMSIIDNVIAVDYHKAPLSRRGWLDEGAAREAAVRVIAEFGVAARSPDMPIGALSGGNMQKVVLGREVMAQPLLLIASQPTRGVDIGAAESLRQRLAALRDSGAAILLISADLDELLSMSDRIAVLSQGRIAGHFAGASATALQLGPYMAGARCVPGAAANFESPFVSGELP
jgi:ABC-type uncharacterized transport system ATPase subunit